jgi:hypothetical protein
MSSTRIILSHVLKLGETSKLRNESRIAVRGFATIRPAGANEMSRYSGNASFIIALEAAAELQLERNYTRLSKLACKILPRMIRRQNFNDAATITTGTMMNR